MIQFKPIYLLLVAALFVCFGTCQADSSTSIEDISVSFLASLRYRLRGGPSVEQCAQYWKLVSEKLGQQVSHDEQQLINQTEPILFVNLSDLLEKRQSASGLIEYLKECAVILKEHQTSSSSSQPKPIDSSSRDEVVVKLKQAPKPEIVTCDELVKLNDQLKEQVEVLKRQVNDQTNRLKELSRNDDSMKARVNSLPQDETKLNERNNQLKETESLKKQVNDQTNLLKESYKNVDSLKAKVELLLQNEKRLKTQNDQLKEATEILKKQVSEQSSRLEESRKNEDSLKSRVESLLQNETKLNAQNDQLKDGIEVLKKQVSDKTNCLQDSSRNADSWKVKLNSMWQSEAKLKEEKDNLLSKIRVLESSVAQLNAQLENAKGQLTSEQKDKENRINELESNMEFFKNALSTCGSQQQELTDENQKLKERQAQLQRQIEALTQKQVAVTSPKEDETNTVEVKRVPLRPTGPQYGQDRRPPGPPPPGQDRGPYGPQSNQERRPPGPPYRPDRRPPQPDDFFKQPINFDNLWWHQH